MLNKDRVKIPGFSQVDFFLFSNTIFFEFFSFILRISF